MPLMEWPQRARVSGLRGMENQTDSLTHCDDPRVSHRGHPTQPASQDLLQKGEDQGTRVPYSEILRVTYVLCSEPFQSQGRWRWGGIWEEQDLHPTSLSKAPGGLKMHSYVKGSPD